VCVGKDVGRLVGVRVGKDVGRLVDGRIDGLNEGTDEGEPVGIVVIDGSMIDKADVGFIDNEDVGAEVGGRVPRE